MHRARGGPSLPRLASSCLSCVTWRAPSAQVDKSALRKCAAASGNAHLGNTCTVLPYMGPSPDGITRKKTKDQKRCLLFALSHCRYAPHARKFQSPSEASGSAITQSPRGPNRRHGHLGKASVHPTLAGGGVIVISSPHLPDFQIDMAQCESRSYGDSQVILISHTICTQQ